MKFRPFNSVLFLTSIVSLAAVASPCPNLAGTYGKCSVKGNVQSADPNDPSAITVGTDSDPSSLVILQSSSDGTTSYTLNSSGSSEDSPTVLTVKEDGSAGSATVSEDSTEGKVQITSTSSCEDNTAKEHADVSVDSAGDGTTDKVSLAVDQSIALQADGSIVIMNSTSVQGGDSAKFEMSAVCQRISN